MLVVVKTIVTFASNLFIRLARAALVLNRSRIQIAAVCLGFPLTVACSHPAAAPARGGRGGEGGPVPVVVAKVAQKDVPVDIDGIGNVEAYSSISVRAQITGQLTQVFFREGDFVKKGNELFRIDARPFEAMLEQA